MSAAVWETDISIPATQSLFLCYPVCSCWPSCLGRHIFQNGRAPCRPQLSWWWRFQCVEPRRTWHASAHQPEQFFASPSLYLLVEALGYLYSRWSMETMWYQPGWLTLSSTMSLSFPFQIPAHLLDSLTTQTTASETSAHAQWLDLLDFEDLSASVRVSLWPHTCPPQFRKQSYSECSSSLEGIRGFKNTFDPLLPLPMLTDDRAIFKCTHTTCHTGTTHKFIFIQPSNTHIHAHELAYRYTNMYIFM